MAGVNKDHLYIDKVLNGDEQAFRYFIQQYKNMAYTIAIAVVKDEFTAQEIVQDAFVKAYRGLRLFNRTSSFTTWFYRIVTNESLMYVRSNKKQPDITHITGYDDIADDPTWPEAGNGSSRLVNLALQQLAPNEALALRLFYLQEESIKMVCEITGWSEANAKVILHRARKNMRTILSQLKNKVHE